MDFSASVEQNTDKPMANERPGIDVRDLKVQFQQSFKLSSETWSLAPPLGETLNIPQFAKVCCFVWNMFFLFVCFFPASVIDVNLPDAPVSGPTNWIHLKCPRCNF